LYAEDYLSGRTVTEMKISTCSYRSILEPCGLENFNYQVDPYIGCEHYCYYCYVLAQAETDWSDEILIHDDIVSHLNKELEKISPQTIYMGYHSDPYQPCESKYQQTRKVLELLLKKGFSASILTKSDLVVRDIDILGQMDGAAVSVSVAFNDNQTRQYFEAKTIDTEKRIAALCALKEAGIRTGALLCPVIPYITNVFPLIDWLKPHADVIWIFGLNINDQSDQNWQNMQQILNTQFPKLIKQIVPTIFSKDHSYWAELRENLETIKKNEQLDLNIHL